MSCTFAVNSISFPSSQLLFAHFTPLNFGSFFWGHFCLRQKPGFPQFRANRAPASALVHFVHSLAVAAFGAATIPCPCGLAGEKTFRSRVCFLYIYFKYPPKHQPTVPAFIGLPSLSFASD